MVDHFRVMRLLAQGGMGEVYLARDTKLGRKVALKLIRAKLMASASARERFLFEARATATFNHPHIVTLYEVGEVDGNPYVALEYVEGQTLRQRIVQERPALRESMRIGLAVSEALREAHRHGILHRDLKPTNILIAGDGRLRVVDFGLAKALGGEERAVDGALEETQGPRGTPGYMAPEQWRGDETSPATDVWALGLVLHELIYGKHPYDERPTVDSLRAAVDSPAPVPRLPTPENVPHELIELIARCLAKLPSQRPHASEICDELERLLAGVRVHKLEESPFRGLLPFHEHHAEFFFGREAEVAAFVERLRSETILPVVGPSGAGKSSFVQAGVIARLREQGSWTVLSLRPGSNPFLALAQRLVSGERTPTLTTNELSSPDQPAQPGLPALIESLARELREAPEKLAVRLRARAADERTKVLLFVDQLEELYTLVEDVSLRRRFMAAICTAADDVEDPVRVCFTLRDDFLGRLADGPEARAALSRLMVLRSPGREALLEILERPLQSLGYRYEDPRLVAEMVDAVGEEPACLPLLQFTTRWLWEKRDAKRKLLTRAAYESVGGVVGALATHADGVLDGLSPREVQLARSLLLRLVTPEGTRRVISEERALEGLDARDVLARLIDARLIAVRKGESGAELELAHEALVSRWRTLQRWIEAGREELALVAELTQAAELWARRGRHSENLWVGEVKRERLQLPALVREFLDESQRAERRKQQRRRRAQVGGAVALSAIAVISILVALAFAERSREARHRWAEAQREGARAAHEHGDPLEARARLRGSLETEDSTLGRALWAALERDPLLWRKELGAAVYQVAVAPDGKTVAAACQDQTIYLIDVRTLAARPLRGLNDQITSVVFSPDGKMLASGTWNGSVGLWELPSGNLHVLKGHTSGVWGIAFAPDGKTLVSSSQDGTVRLWNPDSATTREVLTGHTAEVNRVSVSPSGRLLASSSYDHTVRIWNLLQHKLERVLVGHGGAVVGVSFSSDDKLLVTGSWDHTIRVWDVASGNVVKVLGGHSEPVYDVAISPDGKLLASASADKTVRLWSFPDGAERAVLTGHTDRVLNLDFTPDGKRLASGGYDDTVRFWDTSVSPGHVGSPGHTDSIVSVAFSPDAKRLLTGSYDQTLGLWDVASGEMLSVIRGHTHRVYAVGFGPDGKWLASVGGDKTVRLWSTEGGVLDKVLLGHTAAVYGMAISPDGKKIVSGGSDGTAILWDVASGREVLRFKGHSDRIYTVCFSPDGKRVASGSYDNTARVWDAATGKELLRLKGHSDTIDGLAFSPDGKFLATGSEDKTVRLWDLTSGVGRILVTLPGRVYRISFHPDGKRLGLASADGTARILTIADGSMKMLEGHRGEVNDIVFSPDGKLAATASDDRTVRVWDVATGCACWHTSAFVDGEIYTHRGWQSLDGSHAPGTAWRKAIETADTAQQFESRLCIRSESKLSLWDLKQDRELASAAIESSQVAAGRRGCLALSKGHAWWLLDDGSLRDLGAAEAIAWNGDQPIVKSGATAIARGGEALFVGTANGVVSREGGSAFESMQSSAVVSLAVGPMSTVLAGYANGALAIWHRDNGALLEEARLHGPVEHLQLRGGKLYAATKLGDYRMLDLSVFSLGYCDVMRKVWQNVSVVWEGGGPVERAIPRDHPCAR
jgi:WD40 repeat protein/tRNA A-37 threonylcarbamoyl transferase component Bud32